MSHPNPARAALQCAQPLEAIPTLKKILILSVLCFALFLDVFNNSSLTTAIPPISRQLGISNSQSVWILSAYQLTFAALLLISGRISDLYNPKWVFVTGSGAMSVFSLAAGFSRRSALLMIFRALMGAGGSLTIPSSMNLIVHLFTEPGPQAKALALSGAVGGTGMAFGLIIGALFVEFTSWPWVFHFTAIVAGLITLAIIIQVPSGSHAKSDTVENHIGSMIHKIKKLDFFGVTIFALMLILFIFSVTSGSIDGWKSPKVLAPLLISVVLAVGFFTFEARLPEHYAALPPKMWKYENFTILIIISLFPFAWWGSVYPLFAWLWELIYGWSAIKMAIHFLPIAIGVFPCLPLSAGLQAKIPLKWVLVIGEVLAFVGTTLLPFANSDSPERYWHYAFPGFLLGTAGCGLIYMTANIALLAVTPASVSGIVSAVFMATLQTSAATGVAIITSIQTSVQPTPISFKGRAAGLWFLAAFIGFVLVITLVFMKDTVGPVSDPEALLVKGTAEGNCNTTGTAGVKVGDKE